MAGLSAEGLTIRTQPEIYDLLRAAVLAAIPGIDIEQGPEQAIISSLSEQLAEAWESLLALHSAPDPDFATGVLLDKVAALTGSKRRQPTRSRVLENVLLNPGTLVPARSIVAVNGVPDAQFRTLVDVENTTGIAAVFGVQMEAVDTGPVAAPAGTLTVIVTPVPGWIAAANALDAALGRAVAKDPELREARVVELAGRGTDSYDAIRAAVAKVAEVLEAAVYGNEELATVSGRPGKSFEVVVWDGDPAGALDDEIAQAIYDAKPSGMKAFGVGESGSATTKALEDFPIDFTRAAALRVYVDLEVVLAPGTGSGWEAEVKAAIAGRGDLYRVGEKGYASQLVCAVLDDVKAIVAIPTLTLGVAPAPVGSSVVATYAQIIRISSGDVTVSEA